MHGTGRKGINLNRTQAESVFGDLTNQETPLIEILYADAGIIDSLRSMLPEQAETEEPEAPEPPLTPDRRQLRGRTGHSRPDAGLLIDAQESAPKSPAPVREPQAAPKTPEPERRGDARIAALLRTLNVPKTKGTVLPSSERSLLVHLEGQLQYYNKRTYEKIMRRQTGLKLLLDQPDARPAEDLTTVNLAALNLEPARLGEDDLTGYADTLGGAVLALLPPGPGFFLTLRGSKRPFYVPTPARSLRYAPKRIESLFPSFELGKWKILAYYPAAVKSPPAKEDAETPRSLLDSMSDLMRRQSEILAACGFPAERLQPLLIYRDVAIADI